MIVRPVIIVGAPRSGTTILQRCLYLHPEVWHLRAESHHILEGPFDPRRSGYPSNRVTEHDLTDELVKSLRRAFYQEAINLNRVFPDPAFLLKGRTVLQRAAAKYAALLAGALSRLGKPDAIRFLEKTPKNVLRIPMLRRLFPDAIFVALRRNAVRNIDSLVAGWRTVDRLGPLTRRRFTTYPLARRLELADYDGTWWKYVLVPGWPSLKGRTVADVAAWQYYQCNAHMLDDLAPLAPERVFSLKHEDFVRHPVETVRAILEWAGLPANRVVEKFAGELPIIGHTRTRREMKVLRYPDEVWAAIERLPQLADLHRRLGYLSYTQDIDYLPD